MADGRIAEASHLKSEGPPFGDAHGKVLSRHSDQKRSKAIKSDAKQNLGTGWFLRFRVVGVEDDVVSCAAGYVSVAMNDGDRMRIRWKRRIDGVKHRVDNLFGK